MGASGRRGHTFCFFGQLSLYLRVPLSFWPQLSPGGPSTTKSDQARLYASLVPTAKSGLAPRLLYLVGRVRG